MCDGYRLLKMNHFPVKDPEMIMKYASLGYFHYQYIKGLYLLNSCENLVKDNGVIRGENSQFPDGNYIQISVVDFNRKKKICCIFFYEEHRLRVCVGDLIDLCEYIHIGLNVDDSNCFVKFDLFTITS